MLLLRGEISKPRSVSPRWSGPCDSVRAGANHETEGARTRGGWNADIATHDDDGFPAGQIPGAARASSADRVQGRKYVLPAFRGPARPGAGDHRPALEGVSALRRAATFLHLDVPHRSERGNLLRTPRRPPGDAVAVLGREP